MKVSQLLALARIPTLAATAVPIVVGGALGYSAGEFDPLAWLDVFVVALLMQVATNAINEHGDFGRSVDKAPGPGFAGIIVSKQVSAREVLVAASACYGAAFVLGLALVWVRGPVMLLLGAAAILVGVLYSEGPLPISSTPFGELIVGLVMGVAEVVASDLAAAGAISGLALTYSVPVSLTVMAILVANNVRDISKDRESGRRTLVVLIGRERGVALLFVLVLLAEAWSVPAFLLFSAPASVFLLWLALPAVLQSFAKFRKDASWRDSVTVTARLHLIIGALLVVSILFPL